MKIGLVKEIKNNENRVALTPAGVFELTQKGHQVLVETNAGLASGYSNLAYEQAGAQITTNAKEVFENAQMITKVKEPLPEEYALIQPNQIVFTYFHFAANETLTKAMIQSKAVCIAYETIEKADKSLPLLTPMSEVAGRMAVQEGAKYLEKPQGGLGILLGGVPGVKPANVLILGGGVVGYQAAKMAAGLGANVNILEMNPARIRFLDDNLPANVDVLMSNQLTIDELLPQAHLVIGAVLIPGAKAPFLIKKYHLKTMMPGAVMVDVAVDQGGCIETCRPTTHAEPTFFEEGILHYCVANMPGAVPVTSTKALTNATLPYVLQIANKGWQKACLENKELELGINVVSGNVTNQAVANTFDMNYEPVDKFLI